jgi:hypothetical protein
MEAVLAALCAKTDAEREVGYLELDIESTLVEVQSATQICWPVVFSHICLDGYLFKISTVL